MCKTIFYNLLHTFFILRYSSPVLFPFMFRLFFCLPVYLFIFSFICSLLQCRIARNIFASACEFDIVASDKYLHCHRKSKNSYLVTVKASGFLSALLLFHPAKLISMSRTALVQNWIRNDFTVSTGYA